MKQWPHSPAHIFNHKGTYMVTGATLHKELLFKSDSELDLLQEELFEAANILNWRLEAWALFPNHYHIITQAPEDPSTLPKMISRFHACSARKLNKAHNTAGRKVWFQYWDSQLTYHESYLARLNYVIQNPVKHKMVMDAREYKWCSAAWFEDQANKSHVNTVLRMKIDTVSVKDDF